MKIAVVGTGYVGLVSGICYAELGHDVSCIDKDRSKIETLRGGGIPIYEPGLRELSVRNLRAGRLRFTADVAEGVRGADVVVIAVGTPSLPSGEADLSHLEAAAADIGRALEGYAVVCVKSTVPVGTNERVARIVREHFAGEFDIASLPEFLREGTAVHDTLHPDRVVIGAAGDRAARILAELHRPLTQRIVVTDIRSAEMIKYASNAFLATKISFINEIANLCEKVGADVAEVAAGMGMDSRIGGSFLRAGIGYGGSCFPKDTKALIQIAGNVAYDFKLLKAVVEVNRQQRYGVIEKLARAVGDLAGRTIAVWGLSFKPETDDVRESPALDIIDYLVGAGAAVKAYDPVATDNFRRLYGEAGVTYCASALEAAQGADALCLLTEWKELTGMDLGAVGGVMNRRSLIDGRNGFDGREAAALGFDYYPVGRPHIPAAAESREPVLE